MRIKAHLTYYQIALQAFLAVFFVAKILASPLDKKTTDICRNQIDCKYLLTEDLRNRQFGKRPTRRQLCEFCHITIPLVRELIKRNKTDHIHDIASFVCEKLNLADDTVCNMAVSTYQVKENYFVIC